MSLKIPPKKSPAPPSPEELFRTLRGRSADIQSLWSHQADVLRSYMEHSSDSDLALELPTGSGKTLVGLLIAEYRRQARQERVAFLCPTRQLAQQVGARAMTYGIPAVVLVGKQSEYSPKDWSDYTTGAKIAVTTYSGVFNSNPRINDANCLILDDAHAGETYIAHLWSLEIRRDDHEELYRGVLDTIAPALPDSMRYVLNEASPTPDQWTLVAKVPQLQYWAALPELRSVIEARVAAARLQYTWQILREHMEACNVFVTWDHILIRPLAPPAQTHAPFWTARQRVYMSATLGEGGELERATGVRRITRLPMPATWQRTIPGRRLVLLPDLSISEAETAKLVSDVIATTPRALVLSPNQSDSADLQDILKKLGTGKKFLHASDIETSIEPFTASGAILFLTNRYDGLDLPGETCRLLIVAGLPTATNLQERFIVQRLGADSVLRNRVRTRVMQALGRCTRNDTDYVAVLLTGGDMVRAATQSEFRAGMHPDLQVELLLGIENSKDTTASALLEAVKEFLSSPDARKAVDDYVTQERGGVSPNPDPVTPVLGSIVGDELAYVYALWNGQLVAALEAAKRVCDGLHGGKELKPYAGLWFYLASAVAQRLADSGESDALGATARDLAARAVACSPHLGIVPNQERAGRAPDEQAERQEADVRAVDAAAEVLVRLGMHGSRFEKHIATVERGLAATSAAQFHEGLEKLGMLLGFDAARPSKSEQAAPDCIWSLAPSFVVTFEAKSDVDPKKQVSVSDVRQAKGHPDWARPKLGLPSTTTLASGIATYQTSLDAAAAPLSSGLFYVGIGEHLRRLLSDIAAALRAVRTSASGADTAMLREVMLAEFDSRRLLPSQILLRFPALDKLAGR